MFDAQDCMDGELGQWTRSPTPSIVVLNATCESGKSPFVSGGLHLPIFAMEDPQDLYQLTSPGD